MATTAALAASLGLPNEVLGSALAAPLKPADVPTTLQQTIRMSQQSYKKYRTLVAAPGEPYIPRIDVLRKAPNPARVANRRSLLYIGHLSDIHIIDAQSPARLDAMAGADPALFAGVIRPQDTLTTNVLAAMTEAISAAAYSPLTGAPMAAALNTGDSADQHSTLELEWYIDIMDGQPVTPSSGTPGQYEGPQIWEAADYAYHPENPEGDSFGAYGFPKIPGLLTAAVSQTVRPIGLGSPWYAVFGNHDSLLNGFMPIDHGLQSLAVGGRKAEQYPALFYNYLRAFPTDTAPFLELTTKLVDQFATNAGMREVTADDRRRLFDQIQFMQLHFQTQPQPGPIGHGFTQNNLDTGQTWWTADLTPQFRIFGLDTCNSAMGADGAVPQNQFDWLKEQLAQAKQENRMAIVLSHHNSLTLENEAKLPIGASQNLVHAEEFIAMMQGFPNMVAWINGHTHINTIQAHPTAGGGGFWEITTASCVDWPQEQQLIEFMDNRDGTMSIFSTALDHTSAAEWRQGDFSQTGLASLSRQLSANDWIETPPMRIGSPLDRNVELLLPAPFDLFKISDADLEQSRAISQAKLVAHSQRVPS